MRIEQDQSGDFQPAEQVIARHRDVLMERFPLPPASAAKPRRRGKLVLAAVVAAAAGVAVLWADPAYRTDYLSTPVGHQLTAGLADGSRIVLNTDTRLDIAWHLRSRRVQLHTGQALFDVEHKTYRPFTVEAGDTRVTVVGTMFDVWRKPESVQVTVLRGRVKVQSGGEPVYLTENQQVQAVGQQVSAVAAVDAATQTVWKDGKLMFDRTPLRNALQEMQRYISTRIAPVDDELGSLRVSGVFDTARADAMLDLLPAILPVAVARDGSNGVVRIKAR